MTSIQEDNESRHHHGGEASHPLGQEQNDGTQLRVPSLEVSPVDENEPESAEESIENDKEVTPEKRDIFDDLAALGRPIDEIVGSERLLSSLSIRKPKRDEWIRVHPVIHTKVYIYEARDSQSWHIVLPEVVEPMVDVVRYVQLSLAVNYGGSAFVWPVPVPTERKAHRAHVTAFAGAERAMREWVRVSWGEGEYEVYRRSSARIEPTWPMEIHNASDMLRFASKGGGFDVIDSLDHPVVRELQGRD